MVKSEQALGTVKKLNFEEKHKTTILEIPEVPKMGNLELKQIEKSKYMIC